MPPRAGGDHRAKAVFLFCTIKELKYHKPTAPDLKTGGVLNYFLDQPQTGRAKRKRVLYVCGV